MAEGTHIKQDGALSANVPTSKQVGRALERRLEALLFVAPAPVPLADLARILSVSLAEVETSLEALQKHLEGRGLVLQRLRNKVQLVTAPDLSKDIERFLGLNVSHSLSAAAVETLAIIAYKQPVTRAEIEALRGVNSDGVLRSLVSKGLVEEVGRKETVGRPILYGTSMNFLQYFGLRNLSELPPLKAGEVTAETLEKALQEAGRRDREGRGDPETDISRPNRARRAQMGRDK